MAHYASSNGHGNGTSVQPVEKEDEIYRRIVIVTSVGYVCAILTIFMVINDKVPSPYMDEVFHVGQARAYCVGNFTQVRDFKQVRSDCFDAFFPSSGIPKSRRLQDCT